MGLRRNAIVGQSGGPTAAINATLSGVIQGCTGKFHRLYGMKNGIEGLFSEELVALDYLFYNERAQALLARTPSAVLGSCRRRLSLDSDAFLIEKAFNVLEKYSIGCFFYIGGNDSMDTVAKLSRYAQENSIPVSFVGIPKTIDNDLVLTDHTPGYGSCAKYIATAVSELYRDVSVYNIPTVTVLEVMGRSAGWLGCACALPTVLCGQGCQLVYIPEMCASTDELLADADNFLKKHNTLLIGMSEGAFPLHSGEADSFGHTRVSGGSRDIEAMIARSLGCKCRGIELNLLQRCASHLLSATDINESILIGKSAVDMALEGQSGVMAAFSRQSGEYGVDVVSVASALVANRVKPVPGGFFDEKKRFVTNEFFKYASPLILGEMRSEYEGGLPHYFNLR